MSVLWVGAAATVAGAAITANASSKANKAQAQSAREANNTQLEAQRDAQEFQQKQLDQSRADQEPWRQAGVNALGQLTQRTAPGGDLMRNFAMSDFQADPGYAFRQAEGQKAITNSAAARGGLLSGAAAKAIAGFSQNLASAEVGNAHNRFTTNQTNQFNRLASVANVGQTAANQNSNNAIGFGNNVGNALMNTAGNIANNQIGVGNARASGYLAQGNALTGALNQGVSAWKQQNQPSYNAWANHNAGVMNSTGLSANDLGTF